MTEQSRRRRAVAPTLEQQIVTSSQTEPKTVEPVVGPDLKAITVDRLIPSGVTLLNCACSDNPFGAFALGSINTIPGKSASGKTELALNILASCAIDKRFDKHELILDDAEHAMSFDLNYLFPPLVGRLKAPRYDKDEPIYSETIQDLEGNMLLLCKPKKPFIYFLDSLDGLSSTQELEREYTNALKMAKSKEAVKELKQSYGTEKARIIGATLRMIDGAIKKSDSAFFMIQQTRQNLNKIFKYQPDWITAGGEAPFFYSFHRVYLNSVQSHTGESRNIKHKIGGKTIAQVIKNKLTGKRRSVEFDIYEDLGIDDIASCIDFLKTTECWSSNAGGMTAPGILPENEKMYRADLIRYIEESDEAILKLRTIVGEIWNEIEDDIRPKDRKRRF